MLTDALPLLGPVTAIVGAALMLHPTPTMIIPSSISINTPQIFLLSTSISLGHFNDTLAADVILDSMEGLINVPVIRYREIMNKLK
jgi:hypothetical protein